MYGIHRAVSRATIFFLFVATLGACAHKPSEPLVRDELVQITATVEAVNVSRRLVSLRGPKGLATINVAPDVCNLEQVQLGDRLVVSYYSGIAAQIKKRSTPNGGFENVVAAVEAPNGVRPAHSVGETIATTVKIESVDTSFDTVTFRRPDGFVRTLAIESPEGRAFIRKLSPGDEVEVMYTEAIAVEVVT